jgi:Periplasmic serine proteases (ClpP class)
MGYFSEYMSSRFSFEELTIERKKWLKKIKELRGRDVLVYASDYNKSNAPISIGYSDLIPFRDQLSFIKTDEIDVMIETPGGSAESVEDMVDSIRTKFEKLGVIIPGSAKSAGTIFTMAGDEILMGADSSLGPIDAQMMMNGKYFSADAFLDGLTKIKEEVLSTGKLNPAYIPILQNISPGEIQRCENAQNFSRTLVTNWLKTYKFKYWETRNTSRTKVTDTYKETRAKEIADKLCKHSDWLTHGRSIRISDLEQMKLLITDYSKDADLSEAIDRYYTLLRMTFDMTGIYKIFETVGSQIYQSVSQAVPPTVPIQKKIKEEISSASTNFMCPKCGNNYKIQLNLKPSIPIEKGAILYPKDDVFICPNCSTQTNLAPMRLNLEAQTRLKVIK